MIVSFVMIMNEFFDDLNNSYTDLYIYCILYIIHNFYALQIIHI